MCRVVKDHAYNGDFTVLRGKEFFKNGELCFTPGPPQKFDGFYRTVFGPSIASGSVTYCRCDACIRLAFRRMTASRKPELPGYEKYMRSRQTRFIAQHQTFISHLAELYSPYFDFYEGAELEAEKHHDDPHPKRALRKAAWLELHDTGGRYRQTFLERDGKPQFVVYKMKTAERAKPGKYPRMIGDLGTPASLRGAWVTELLKKCMNKETVEWNGGFMYFCKSATASELDSVFQRLLDPPGRFFFVYFSDDSCLSFRDEEGRVHWFNIDISGCDASHTGALFETIESLVPKTVKGDVEALVEQCRQPIQLRSTVNRKERVVLRAAFPKLYSGSTLTTAINNLANLLIACAISEGTLTPEGVNDAASEVGYLVTCDVCKCPEDIQFLKHSPVMDLDGRYRPVLNLGAFLEASGNCKGDLPGRGSLKARAEAFQSGLVRSMYPHATIPLLKGHITTTETHPEMGRILLDTVRHKVDEDNTYPDFIVDESSLYRRYELLGSEIVELHELFGKAKFLDHVNCTAIQKILAKDYGRVTRSSYREVVEHCESRL